MNKNKKYWGTSLRKFPWMGNSIVTPTQKLITSTVLEWYDAKHRCISEEEINLINSLEIEECPFCNSNKFVKNGKDKHGIQRYKCLNNSCNKRFNPLTGTIFDSHKIAISEWIEYLMHLLEFHSIITSARDNKNASTTGHYWLSKIFYVLKDCQENIVLNGTIYIDEIFFPVAKSRTEKKAGRGLRGISKNKIAVAVAFDSNNLIIHVENTSKPSLKSTWEALGSRIKEGSHIIHDGERSHSILLKKLNLTEEYYKTAYTKKLKDEDNPLDPINNLHSYIKRFMKMHGGYNRDNLQDWMNLIWFILSKPENRYEKIESFLKVAIKKRQIIRYRDVFGK